MKIGDKVKYIKHENDKVFEGEGTVRAYGLDHEQRIVVLIADKERLGEDGNPKVFNTFERCVNPTNDFKAKFRKLVSDVDNTTTTANAEIKKITDEANNLIGKLHDDILGKPVEL